MRGCRSARALALAYGLTVSPDGRNVYVASFGTSAVAVLARHASGRTDARSRRAANALGVSACCLTSASKTAPRFLSPKTILSVNGRGLAALPPGRPEGAVARGSSCHRRPDSKSADA
jgi:hypothetical protein